MKFYFYFIFINAVFNAQIVKGKILSKNDNSPIPFAKIGIGNENKGTITDEKGNYILDLNNVNRELHLNISIGGFENFSVNIGKFIQKGNYDIILKEKIKSIEEIIIVNKKYKSKNVGVNSKSKKILFAVYPDRKKEKEEQSREFAIKISNRKKAKLEKININVAEFNTDVPVKIRFNVYSEKNGIPNQSLLYDDLISIMTKESIINDTFTFDISKKGIYVNDDFFVSIQFMNFFKGQIFISGALFRNGFLRHYYGEWEKVSLASPAINIQLKIEQ